MIKLAILQNVITTTWHHLPEHLNLFRVSQLSCTLSTYYGQNELTESSYVSSGTDFYPELLKFDYIRH
jgi:hypothetical protein